MAHCWHGRQCSTCPSQFHQYHRSPHSFLECMICWQTSFLWEKKEYAFICNHLCLGDFACVNEKASFLIVYLKSQQIFTTTHKLGQHGVFELGSIFNPLGQGLATHGLQARTIPWRDFLQTHQTCQETRGFTTYFVHYFESLILQAAQHRDQLHTLAYPRVKLSSIWPAISERLPPSVWADSLYLKINK